VFVSPAVVYAENRDIAINISDVKTSGVAQITGPMEQWSALQVRQRNTSVQIARNRARVKKDTVLIIGDDSAVPLHSQSITDGYRFRIEAPFCVPAS